MWILSQFTSAGDQFSCFLSLWIWDEPAAIRVHTQLLGGRHWFGHCAVSKICSWPWCSPDNRPLFRDLWTHKSHFSVAVISAPETQGKPVSVLIARKACAGLGWACGRAGLRAKQTALSVWAGLDPLATAVETRLTASLRLEHYSCLLKLLQSCTIFS